MWQPPLGQVKYYIIHFLIAQAIIMVCDLTVIWLILNLAFYQALALCINIEIKSHTWLANNMFSNARITHSPLGWDLNFITVNNTLFVIFTTWRRRFSQYSTVYLLVTKHCGERGLLLLRLLLCCLITVTLLIIVNNVLLGFIALTYASLSVHKCNWDSV